MHSHKIPNPKERLELTADHLRNGEVVVFDRRSIHDSLFERETLHRDIFAENGRAVFDSGHRFHVRKIQGLKGFQMVQHLVQVTLHGFDIFFGDFEPRKLREFQNFFTFEPKTSFLTTTK